MGAPCRQPIRWPAILSQPTLASRFRRLVDRYRRLQADDARYQELVTSRADALSARPEDLLKSPFFPAYRAKTTCDSAST
jgi:hypothetical protein